MEERVDLEAFEVKRFYPRPKIPWADEHGNVETARPKTAERRHSAQSLLKIPCS
jgi:hypothetical protein